MSRKSQLLSEQMNVSVIKGRSAGTIQFLDGIDLPTMTRTNGLWPKDCSMHSQQPHKTRDRQLFHAGKVVVYFQWQPSKLITANVLNRSRLCVVVEWPATPAWGGHSSPISILMVSESLSKMLRAPFQPMFNVENLCLCPTPYRRCRCGETDTKPKMMNE